jgi:uncharacterized DUF497 family protein
MRISFDPVSRNLAFAASGLAFEDAAIVFEGRTLDMVEDGFDYPEERIRIITIAPPAGRMGRIITVGHLADLMVIVVWTQRGGARYVISMRKANEREKERFAERLG